MQLKLSLMTNVMLTISLWEEKEEIFLTIKQLKLICPFLYPDEKGILKFSHMPAFFILLGFYIKHL